VRGRKDECCARSKRALDPNCRLMADSTPRPTGLIGRNVLWLFVSQVLTWMVSVIVLILAPDRLGADDFGLLNFTMAFVGFFNFVGVLGTGQLITRTAARDPDTLAPYVVNGVVMKLLLSVALSALALGLGSAFGYDGKTLLLLSITLGGMTLSLINDVLYGGLVAVNRVARPAMWWVVQTYLAAGLAILVLFTSRSVIAYAGAYAIALLVPVATNALNIRQFITGSHRIDLTLWWTMIKQGAPLLILAGLILIYGTIDIPLLQSLTDNVTVAHYTLAYRWVTIPIFVATAVVQASASSLSAFAVKDHERFVSLSNKSLRLVRAVPDCVQSDRPSVQPRIPRLGTDHSDPRRAHPTRCHLDGTRRDADRE
jgi:O-antigen/teichoic acid export membrane protein